MIAQRDRVNNARRPFASGTGAPLLVAALVFERNARRLGKAGMEQITQNFRGGSVREYFGATGQRMRDRMRREE